jgi:hypothetical protein
MLIGLAMEQKVAAGGNNKAIGGLESDNGDANN